MIKTFFIHRAFEPQQRIIGKRWCPCFCFHFFCFNWFRRKIIGFE